MEKMIYEILEIAETELRKASLDDLRRGYCASLACRAAIKINMRLDTKRWNGCCARSPRHLPDELPARPADCDALLHARDIEKLSSDLSRLSGGGSGGRTHTFSEERQILSLVRLPVSPFRHG